MEYKRRHQLLWTLLRPLVKLILWIKFNYHATLHSLQGSCIVISNHVTDWDPLFLGVSFRDQMYFVASEHILRQGFVSRLLQWAQPPITRQKGGSAAGAVKAILRTLKEGHKVGLFAEGNRCWDGVTRDFPASTGKLVKSSGASLVTFRLTGGYFASPRWAGTSTRRGRVDGQLVHIYKPDQLRQMSVEQINDLIRQDIYEDATETQRRHGVPFRGKRLAEHLETLLFICPKCGAMHRLRSQDDRFFCESCGLTMRYTLGGSFTGSGLPFDNVRDWSRWQEGKLRALCESAGDEAIFHDSGMELRLIHSAKSAEWLGEGELGLYRDRLELPEGITLPIEEIRGMSLRGNIVLYISTAKGRTFELRSRHVRCTGKYLAACRFLGAAIGVGV